jgi:hypothetical protein
MKLKKTMILAGALLSAQFANGAEITVDSDITRNTKWTKDNVYIIDKSIFVKNGATLLIEPGTLILGTSNVLNDTRGSLVVTRDGTIDAVGTKEEPIVFTAKEEYDGVALDPAMGDGGYWGGVVILGNAPINFYTGPTTNANENEIEGFPAGSTLDIRYGGRDSSDSSGRLKYVSIRFGGYEFAPNKEINGLTLGGVGFGTEIENIEIISNTDDGIEFFGGTVNTKRIAVAFAQDDSFDIDEGHRGFHQFWFSIQNADGTIGDRGGEWDGGNGTTKTGSPFTNTRIYNATILGNGVNSDPAAINDGIYLDDNFAGQIHNSLLHDFNGSMVVNSGDGIGSPAPSFLNTTFGLFGSGQGDVDLVSGTGVTKNVDPILRGISRIANGGLDPRPATNSPLLTGSLSGFPSDAPAGFFEPVNYRGAFGDTNWLDGWSYLSQKGYLKVDDVPVVEAPEFKVQPRSAVVALNSKVVLKARATADSAPTYQWFRNGRPIKGATKANLVIRKFTARNAGKYTVRATSGEVSTNSRVAIVQQAKITSGLKPANAKKDRRFRDQVKTNFKANSYTAKGLPAGLKIGRTGLIVGTPTKAGTYRVTITAVRKAGAKTVLSVVGRKVIKVS